MDGETGAGALAIRKELLRATRDKNLGGGLDRPCPKGKRIIKKGCIVNCLYAISNYEIAYLSNRRLYPAILILCK